MGRTPRAAWAAAVAFGLGAGPAQAATEFNPFATIDVRHDSNVFALENPSLVTPGASADDTIQRYIAGLSGDFKWGPNSLTLNVQGARHQYASNSQLSHFETGYNGLLTWHLTPILSGDLQYAQSRTMTAPGNTLSQELELQTDKTASATMRLLLTPRWRFDLKPQWHQLDSPLPQFPEFGYQEKSASASINYLGIQKLTAGLRGSYLEGSYHHIENATRYHQKVAELTAAYAISGFSSFDGQAGYTWRDTSPRDPNAPGPVGGGPGGLLGKTKDFTGALGFTRKLSVKTAVSFKIFREIDSYEAGANPFISTGGEFNVKWQPDYRFTFDLSYRQVRQAIQGTQVISDFAGRNDRDSDIQLTVKYTALRWLTLRPYALRHLRSSNLQLANYTSTVVGIEITGRLHQGE